MGRGWGGGGESLEVSSRPFGSCSGPWWGWVEVGGHCWHSAGLAGDSGCHSVMWAGDQRFPKGQEPWDRDKPCRVGSITEPLLCGRASLRLCSRS